MSGKLQLSDFGISLKDGIKGKLNNICDVPGVKVGHCTIDKDDTHTGVTVILPCEDNPFERKLPAAAVVFNGFGKTQGTIQIEELGTIETPIAMTNTLNVGKVHDAMAEYMTKLCANDNVEMFSVNPIITECNDCSINNIHKRAVEKEHFYAAVESASGDFIMGDIGAGRGMICHGMKGGIGSASRILDIGGKQFTLGVLVLTNHGRMENLMIGRVYIGHNIAKIIEGNEVDKGSCIIIMATDLLLDSRQIRRVISRASVGLARLGSFIGNGSGELAIGFTTANRKVWNKDQAFESSVTLNESLMDIPFEAMADCTEEAILRSMINSDSAVTLEGKTIHSLREFIAELN